MTVMVLVVGIPRIPTFPPVLIFGVGAGVSVLEGISKIPRTPPHRKAMD